MSRLNDLTGRRFGAITVIGRDPTHARGDAYWICRCDRCGEMKSIRGVYLTGRRAYQDCGCAWAERKADLTGRTMGGAEVIRRIGTKNGQKLYLARCTHCGREYDIVQHNLLLLPISCGCMNAMNHTITPEEAARNYRNGASISAARAKDPLPTSKTGYRWVRWYPRNRCWCATFRVAGERYFKYGFATPDAAYRWAIAEHTRAAIEAGIDMGEEKKDDESAIL